MGHDGNRKKPSGVCQVYTVYPQDWILLWCVLSAWFITVTAEEVRLYKL